MDKSQNSFLYTGKNHLPFYSYKQDAHREITHFICTNILYYCTQLVNMHFTYVNTSHINQAHTNTHTSYFIHYHILS